MQWLAAEQLSLALTTYHVGGIILLGNKPDGRASVHVAAFDRSMGCWTDGQTMWLVTERMLWRLENDLADGNIDAQGYDRVFVPRVGYTIGEVDGHEVDVDAAGRPVFVNTAFSCLATIDERYNFRPLWQPAFISQLAPEDRCHLSGLAMTDGQPKYVSMHAKSDVADGWRDFRETGGLVIDVQSNQVAGEGLSMPHSPRMHDGKLWLLNSGTGHLGFIDPKSGRLDQVTFLPGYARGLSFHGNIAIVGLSKPRREHAFQGLPLEQNLQHRGAAPQCGVSVIDLESGSVLHWARIESQVEELFDVKVLPGVSCPKVLSFATPDYARQMSFELSGRLQRLTIASESEEHDPRSLINASSQPSSVMDGKTDLQTAKHHFQSGKAAQAAGEMEEAEAAFRQAIALYPDYATAHHQLGLALVTQNRFSAAKSQFQRVLSLDSQSAAAHTNLARIHAQQNQPEDAISHFRKALRLNRNYIPALVNLALLYRELYQLDHAVVLLKRAFKLDPGNVDVTLLLGEILDYFGQFTNSRTVYEQHLALAPNHEIIAMRLGMLKLRVCDWRGYDRLCERAIAVLTDFVEGRTQHTPGIYELHFLPIPPDLMSAALRRCGQEISQSVERLRSECNFTSPQTAARLRIGYASPDFAEHAVGRLLRDLFQHHNREEFEVYGYGLRPFDATDPYSQSIQEGFDRYRDLAHLSDEEAAQAIHDDGIHLLINLAGYTAFGRPKIFALRPAPIQVHWLGFPDTMGADFIQYMLADRWIAPPDSYQYYQETVIQMPQAFVGTPVAIADTKPTRSAQGLPEQGFVFGCFNTHHKIEPEVFGCWMRILQQVPASVLWLASPKDAMIVENLHRAAEDLGIDANRIIFAKKLSYEAHLSRLSLVDLGLDTLIYSAGSTAIACLNAGVPLLTKAGLTNASRMGASICAAVGLESMICQTTDSYEQKAVELAVDAEQLNQIRERLQVNQETLPLFNQAMFVSHLERTYQQLWKDFVGR